MHNLVRRFTVKNQEDNASYENKEGTNLLGHDNLSRGKEEETWRKSDWGTTYDPLYHRRAEPHPR